MKKTTGKLPKQQTQALYDFKNQAGFFETTTSGDPTNTISTVLTTTHIGQK